jgi:uncharacterized lipoprotein YehR (DUF1307 family)
MIMKRLALLAVAAFMAVLLSACGENAEKKTNSIQQNQSGLSDAAKDADSKLHQNSTDTGVTPAPAPAPGDANQPTPTGP